MQPVLCGVHGDVFGLRRVADTEQTATTAQDAEGVFCRFASDRVYDDVVDVLGNSGEVFA